jgi:hypothetical protein
VNYVTVLLIGVRATLVAAVDRVTFFGDSATDQFELSGSAFCVFFSRHDRSIFGALELIKNSAIN